MLTSRTIAVSINKPLDDVYAFAQRPENFSQWVAELRNVTYSQGEWRIEGKDGHYIEVDFTPQNPFGVLDYTLILTGTQIYNPLRLIWNEEGCELLLTIFRYPETSDEQFELEVNSLREDLLRLKQLMEDGDESVVRVDFNSKRK